MIADFIQDLISVESKPTLLNQYRDDCPIKDSSGNFGKRIENLRGFLNFLQNPPLMIIGESAGYNGAKISGLHLFTQNYFLHYFNLISVMHKNIGESATSKHLDNVFCDYSPPLAFNIVPYFTHDKNTWIANRTPSKIEIKNYSEFSKKLYEIFRPKIVIAMGRMAQYGLDYQGVPNEYARHPSMGGIKKFEQQLTQILK